MAEQASGESAGQSRREMTVNDPEVKTFEEGETDSQEGHSFLSW